MHGAMMSISGRRGNKTASPKVKLIGVDMPTEAKVYDRIAADLPINSVVAAAIVKDGAGDHIRVLRSVRDDPLAGMLSRKQIDQAQFDAGRLWQRYTEDSEIGGAQAIDPTKEAVDGGRFKEPDITRQSKALAELKRAHAALGDYGRSIIMDVLARRMSIQEVAAARMMSRQREIDFIGARFRECLESLAALWGGTSRKLSADKLRDEDNYVKF